MKQIDLNSDMGESFGIWRMGADAEVMPWVTSASVACGFHAGDPLTMQHTVQAAAQAGVAIGAHVGLPDLQGFGRRVMQVSAAEVYAMSVVQIGALAAVARTSGARLQHVKAHGALYHMADADVALGEALARAAHDVDPRLRIIGRADGATLVAAGKLGLVPVREEFVDRRYGDDARLLPRTHANALISDPDQALVQALGIVCDERVIAVNGQTVAVHADSLCIHGDRPDAAEFARHIHQGLRAAGIDLHANPPTL